MLSEVYHPGHVQDTYQGLPGLFFFNWVDQWMTTRLNGFNLGGSSQHGIRASLAFYTWFSLKFDVRYVRHRLGSLKISTIRILNFLRIDKACLVLWAAYKMN